MREEKACLFTQVESKIRLQIKSERSSDNTRTTTHPQASKFFGARDPRLLSPWSENAVFKLESIPHHFTAFSLANLPRPTVTVHCLDYVL